MICKRIFIKENYTKIEDDVSFDITQVKIRNQEQISSNISVLIKYVVDFLEYQDKIRTLSENIAMTIQLFVDSSKNSLQKANIVPLLFLIFLGIITENINTKSNIFQYHKIFFNPSELYPDLRAADPEHHHLYDAVLADVQLQGGHLQGREEEDREAAQLAAAHIRHQEAEERYCRIFRFPYGHEVYL